MMLAGRYRLGEPLATGGMGTVWSAHDEVLDRPVAVKEVALPPGLDDPEQDMLRKRTLREARAAARLGHPNIVAVYDVVEQDGRPWIVMELVPSRSLADLLREHRSLPAAEVARIGLRVLDALGVAHSSGILHRDVKPGNVLLGENGRVVLTDFGIAMQVGDSTLTRTGQLLGSPAYIAPERARGGPAGPESDLWGLGALLFAAVEGEPPFQREGPLQTLTAVITEEPPVPRRASGPLRDAIAGLLDKDPDRRLTAAQARDLLRQAVGRHEALPRTFPARRPAPDAPPPTPTLRTGVPDAVAPPPPVTTASAAGPPVAGAPDERPGTPGSPGGSIPGGGTGGSAGAAGAAAVAAGGLAAPAAGEPSAPAVDASADRAAEPASSGKAVAPGRARWLVPLVLVALLAAGVLLVPMLRRDGDPGAEQAARSSASGNPATTGTPAGASTSPTARTSTAAPTPASTAPSRSASPDAAAIPAGFVRYRDPTGFSVAVPEGWQRVRNDPRVDFREPGGTRFLRVDQTDTPAGDPYQDWLRQEGTVSRRLPGYDRIRIDRVDYRGWPAADWEFTWDGTGGRTHVLSRNLVPAPSKAYALYWSVPQSQWAESRSIFDVAARTFTPAT